MRNLFRQQVPELPSDSRENGFSDWIKAKPWSGGERFREAWKHYANVVQLTGQPVLSSMQSILRATVCQQAAARLLSNSENQGLMDK